MPENQAKLMERRRHARMPLFKQIQSIRLDPEPGQVVQELQAFDLSRSGMGVMSKESFYPGQRLVLQVPRNKDNGERSVFATVVRCAKAAEKQYRIGLEFESTSNDSAGPYAQTETVAAA